MEASLAKTSSNILLRAIGPRDQALLAPWLEPIWAEPGDAITRPGAALTHVYFPDAAVISIEETTGLAEPLEVGLIGREGMLGWSALLGCDRSHYGAVAQMRRTRLLRAPLPAIRALCRESAAASQVLLSFVQIMGVQMARAIVSYARDTVEQRLSRWLLMRHDRVGGDELLIRHDEVGRTLSVRRASVTDGLHLIEGRSLVRCRRGRIQIRDRAGLEALAGSSYGVPEAQYNAAIAPFGKSAQALAPLTVVTRESATAGPAPLPFRPERIVSIVPQSA